MTAASASSRRRQLAPILASFVVAGGAAAWMAGHLAPRYDEFHTLAYLQDPDLRSLWRSYRGVGDTVPPAAYVTSWAWSKVAGTSLVATRLPAVVGWAVAAAATTAVTRRAGAWASLVAGVLATATALVFLGAFARPYAPALACAAVGLWCWQRAGNVERARWWLVASAGLFVLASSLHYAVAAVAVVVGVITALGGAEVAHRRGRALAPLIGGLVPILASAALVPQAIDDQGRLDRSVRAFDALAFWPSTLRPAIVPLALAAVVVLAAFLVPGGGRSVARRRLIDRVLLRVGWGLVLAIPVVTVAAMALTSGTYVHRYTMGALIGGAIVAGEATGRAARRWSWAGPVVTAAVLLACALAVRSVSGDLVSLASARALPAELGLGADGADGAAGAEGAAGLEVVVLDEYDYLLLRHVAADGVGRRLRLGSEPRVAHSPAAVDLAARLARADGESIEVIGTKGAIERLVEQSRGWSASPLGEATYVRPGVRQELVLVRLDPPSA